jgi:glycosyltransferase involved in cell wall biosynthesis
VRVLLAADRDGNPFVDQLGASLAARPEIEGVSFEARRFWEEPREAEVLHLHWPEALVGWRDPGEEDLRRVRERLEAWRETAVVVATVHNALPHYRATKAYRRLYRLVYEAADAIVHMGSRSYLDFKTRFPDLCDRHRAFIPHGIYESFPDEISEEDARRELTLAPEDFVGLAFGNLRHPEEIALLLGGFGSLPVRGNRLLVAGTILPQTRIIPRLRLRRQRRRLLSDPRVSFHPGFVPEERVQVFLRACDAVIVPRREVLNSGNLVLGFSFGRVVVGPDIGVVGEILRETGNPVFRPGSRRSLARALSRARELRASGLGERNRRHARSSWSWEEIAARHASLYGALTEERKSPGRR